jgi:acetyl esterase/lipase
VTAVVLAAGCSSTPDAIGAAGTSLTVRAPDSTSEYLPGLEADVYLPAQQEQSPSSPVPIVLLVPGGGWLTADRTGLAPLAADLADAGFVAVNSTYRAGSAGAVFPEPVQDVACATGFAVQEARAAGLEPGPLVALGHSAGGHLAALAAVEGSAPAGPCPYPLPGVTGLIGLAGVYDTRAFDFALVDFFGGTPQEQPEAWRRGDPVRVVDAGGAPQDLQVLLLHGDSDQDVPLDQSRAFEASLNRAGISVALEVVPGATHQTIYSADVAGPAVIAWLSEVAAVRPPRG